MAYGDRRYSNRGNKPAHVSVTPRKNEHPERLIKRFIRKVKKERVLEQIRERRFYEKPSVKRRKKKEFMTFAYYLFVKKNLLLENY